MITQCDYSANVNININNVLAPSYTITNGDAHIVGFK